MRHRIVLAALLAGSASISPAFAQEVEATVAAEAPAPEQVAQVVAAQPVAMAAADQDERRGRGDGGGRGRDFGGEGMQAAPEQIERAPREDWQQRAQAQPAQPVQAQVQPQAQPNWSGGGNADGGWQQRQAPPVMAAPQVPVSNNRGWRGNDGNGGGISGGGWQRHEAPVAQAAPTEPNRSWRGGNDGGWNRGGDQRAAPPPVAQNQGSWNRGNGRPQPQGDWNRRDGDRRGDGGWNRQGNNNGWQHRDADRRWDNDRNWGNDRNWNNNRNWNGGDQNWGSTNQRWNRDWRQDRRYDWERYRYSNRNLYRMPRYYSPYGYNYGYQRFGIGIYLESIFFGSRYRISDPWRYRLPDARWPYEWVRYYDDVLLVDTRNGYVVDVIYDFFW